MAEQKKPDYLDFDWTALIKDRHAKWETMWKELEAEGIVRTYLWRNEGEVPGWQPEAGQPIPSLAIWPVQKEKRGIVIVCAGGGFMFKSANEARPIAEYFHKAGLNAAILDYRFRPYTAEDVREDAKRAIRYIKTFGEEMGIDPEHVAIGGFSAGGMVTSLAITGFDYGNPDAECPIERRSSRPDAAFQMYGSFRAMPTGLPGQEGPARSGLGFSYEKQNESAKADFIMNLPLDAPPMFMAQTDADDPHNVLLMGMAYADRGIPFEAHTFSGGPHGGGLYDGSDEDTPNFPHTSHWIRLAAEWFALRGF